MKIILLLLFSTFYSLSYAKTSVQVCLAQEEQYLHQEQITHFIYTHNQNMINFFTQYPNIYLGNIGPSQQCRQGTFSVELLAKILKKMPHGDRAKKILTLFNQLIAALKLEDLPEELSLSILNFEEHLLYTGVHLNLAQGVTKRKIADLILQIQRYAYTRRKRGSSR